jgi:integrase
MPLTDTAIRNTKPTAKPIKLSDGGGLYLLLNPNGSRWWRLDYRFMGKRKTLSMGVYPDVGLKDARIRRDDARKLLAADVDPGENRKAVKASKVAQCANSLEIVTREWYGKYSTTWNEAHGERIIRRFERDIFPWLGNKAISEITPPELLATIRKIEDRGALETAHRALGNVGQVLRYAIATGRAIRDISADLRGALPPFKSEHFAAVTDPKQVGALLRAMDAYTGSYIVRYALRLAPLVFVRPGELRKALWEDIDLRAGEWRYVVTKTNTPHIVPLSSQAIQILTELQAITNGSRYVFPGARTNNRPMSDNAILAAMRRMGIEKDEMSGHGFRAMARTILDEVLGFRPDHIEHQLAHAVKDPNGRAYNRTAHLPERRKMMQAWSDYLDQLKSGAEIITLTGTA